MLRSRVYFRVLGNFSFLIVVLIAMTLLIANVLLQIERHYKTASSDVEFLNQLERLRSDLVDVPEYLDHYVKTRAPEFKSVFLTNISSFESTMEDLRKKTPDSLSVQSLNQIETIFKEWVQYVAESRLIIADSKSPQDSIRFAQAQLDSIESRGNYLSLCRSTSASLYQRLLSNQALRIESASGLGKDLTRFIIIVNVLFALFAIALGFFLTRSITNPLDQLRTGTRSIMESKFVTLDVTRSDEFGELAKDFNTMSSMLQENYSRVKAYSDMMTTLNENDTLKGVVSESLDLLSQQTKAGIGALYIFNKTSKILYLASGFALPSERREISIYNIGEGIPGECARLNKVLEITDESANGFFVDSGLHRVAPRYIYAFPIIFQENLIGVLVLGSMQKFTEITKGLMESVLPQMGVAITNAQNFEATQELSREISKKADELNVKNQELEKAYRVKSDFLSNMSHELRTPLNSVIGFTSILLGDRGDPLTVDQRKALEKVLKNGKHLLQLINDILDFSKIEAGRMHVSIETESVESVIAGAMMTTEHLIRQKNLEMKEDIELNLPVFKTDVLKIKQIVVNLLSNAAKFTDQGVIMVSARQLNGFIHISVVDSGIGIEPQNLEKVFEEFQQIDTSNSRKYKGTGLGLPIARRLAKLLGGNLSVHSIVGEGSTFTLSIPPELPKSDTGAADPFKDAPKPIEVPLPPTVPVAVKNISKNIFSEKETQSIKPENFVVNAVSNAVVFPVTQSEHENISVLCIDDEPDVIEILRNYLVPEGFKVFSANNGIDGLRLAEKLQPNVITLDIQMPQKDGWEVLRELKANPFTREIPVLIHSIVDNKPLAFSLGAVDYMPKPADPGVVVRMVRKAISSTDNYILVVEDELDYSILLQKFLKEAGYAVEGAYNGKEALEKIEMNAPALILLDLKMPVMDGFEVLKRLKEHNQWQTIPIVIITGIELTTDQRNEIDKQTIDFLRKTEYSMDSLSNLIKKSLTA